MFPRDRNVPKQHVVLVASRILMPWQQLENLRPDLSAAGRNIVEQAHKPDCPSFGGRPWQLVKVDAFCWQFLRHVCNVDMRCLGRFDSVLRGSQRNHCQLLPVVATFRNKYGVLMGLNHDRMTEPSERDFHK